MAELPLRVPSPSTVLRSAVRVVEWELAIARELLSLPARVLALLADVEGIVERIRRLLDEVDHTVASIGGTVAAADAVVARVDRTVDAADGVVDRVGLTVDSADGLVSTAGGLVARVVPMLDLAESALAPVRPVVEALLVDAELDPELARLVAGRIVEVLVYADKTLTLLEPITEEVLTSVDAQEVAAVVRFIDHLPVLGAMLERDVIPVLASLDTVAPEVHQILEVAQQCLEAVAGIPGFQLLRRRGENGKAVPARTDADRPGADRTAPPDRST